MNPWPPATLNALCKANRNRGFPSLIGRPPQRTAEIHPRRKSAIQHDKGGGGVRGCRQNKTVVWTHRGPWGKISFKSLLNGHFRDGNPFGGRSPRSVSGRAGLTKILGPADSQLERTPGGRPSFITPSEHADWSRPVNHSNGLRSLRPRNSDVRTRFACGPVRKRRLSTSSWEVDGSDLGQKRVPS